MSKKKTDSKNIFYYSQVLQEILNLQLNLNMQEIGFTMVFKAAYIYHKGKIPTDKLCQFCRVFEKQEIFANFIEKNYQKKGDCFYSKDYQKEVNLVLDKSLKTRKSIRERWKKKDTNVSTNVSTNGDTIYNVNVNNNNKPSDKKFIKEKESSVKIPEWINSENWNEWLKARKKKRYSDSPLAFKRIINSLERFKADGYTTKQLNDSLERSMIAGYPDIYEPKATKQTKSTGATQVFQNTMRNAKNVINRHKQKNNED